jgi:glycosyltransferase involved in cell wall biosynthesis
MPLFSVIIPVYNRKEMLKRALDSVYAQTFRDFEIIIADDGSNDGTDEICENPPQSIIYLKQNNSGVSAARNLGIKNSASPYIALLDSDDTWHPQKLRMDAEFIKENPGIKIHQSEDIWIREGKRVNPQKKHLKKEGWIFHESLDLCMISPSSAVMSAEIFNKYGLFDENLKACEDYDLWLRITPFEEVGLIREKLITRYSGHGDQLSSLYPVMDRFRLYSIINLLKKGILENKHKERALAKAIEKSEIIRNGAVKRNSAALADNMNIIINYLHEENYKQIDSLILLEI